MTTIAAHVSVEALRERYVSSADVMEARHFQTIWLLAKGHSVGDVLGDDLVRSALDRTARCSLQCGRAGCAGRFAPAQRRARTSAHPRGSREAAGSLARSARRRRSVDERQGRGLSGARTGVGKSRRSTRLGGAEGLRHVDPDAAAEKSKVRHAGRGGGV